MNKSALGLGILLLFWGILIIINPRFYDPIYGRYYDFTGYHVPLGAFVILAGSLFIVIGLRSKAKNYEDKMLICPKCEATLSKREAQEVACPQCKAEMEDLAGFYDRHPELKHD